MRSSRRARTTVTAALTLAVAFGWASGMARTAGAEPTVITGATFEWSVNDEANTGAFNGDCNFMSAGESDGSAGTYGATDGNATVLKRNSDGAFVPISDYSTRCLDAEGVKVTAGGTRRLGQKVVYTGGTGTADPVTGEVSIQWTGTFSNNFYGHLIPFWFADPLLTVAADGTGTVVATVGGYASDIDNPEVRELVDPMPGVVLATLSGVDSRNPNGFVVTPTFAGVQVSGFEVPQSRFYDGWGSWPLPFVAAMDRLGSAAYWYSSGGAADVRKPAAPIVVGFGEGTAPTTTTTVPAPTTTRPPTTTTTVPSPTTTVAVQADGLVNGASSDDVATVGTSGTRRSSSTTTRSSTTSSTGRALASTAAATTAATSVPASLSEGTFGWTVDAGVTGVSLGEVAGAGGARRLSGELGGVTVMDARTGAPSWSVAGQVGDVTGGIAGAHLGWTPRITAPGGGALPGAPIVPGASSGKGLRDPSVLASAPKGHPAGATTLGAAFDLLLPSTAPATGYATTLTITALG